MMECRAREDRTAGDNAGVCLRYLYLQPRVTGTSVGSHDHGLTTT